MNLKLGGYELEAGWLGSGLGSYYSKLEMSALLLCAVLKNSYFRHWPINQLLWEIPPKPFFNISSTLQVTIVQYTLPENINWNTLVTL